MSAIDWIYGEMRARERRIRERRRAPWVAVPDAEPSYEALRDQYCAEFTAKWNNWPHTEWSPA